MQRELRCASYFYSSFLGLKIVPWEEKMDKDFNNSINQIINLFLIRMLVILINSCSKMAQGITLLILDFVAMS